MSKITPEKREKLAIQIIDFLQKREMFTMINIYVNDKRFSSDPPDKGTRAETKKGTTYYITENVDVTKIVEYNNPETITMTFEGPLYHAINYGPAKTEREFLKLLEKHNLYSEQGYAWSLALYEIHSED